MLKTILVPTDFSVKSLNIIKKVVATLSPEQRIKIILGHGFIQDMGITDLLFFRKHKTVQNLTSDVFNAACKILMNKYEDVIEDIQVELFTGHNQGAFELYLEGNKVDELYLVQNYPYQYGKSSFDIIPFIKKSSKPLQSIVWEQDTLMNHQESIASLFMCNYVLN